MINIFKVLPVLILLTFCVNYAKTKINPDIFSIIDENTLQRKSEFSLNDTVRSSGSFSAHNETKLLHYLRLVSDEITELNLNKEQKFNEDPIPLSSAYIELSQDEVKFYEVSFDDFVNFKKASVKLETVIPDGSDPNTIKIIYESRVNELVLSGLAEINGQNCDFVLNLTDLVLREEYERSPAPIGKIVTKSIVETLTFKKFTLLIVSTEGNKHFKSPNKQIFRQLANSWLVSIVNVVNSRFVQPKIVEQSQLYFKNYKNAFLESVCSSVLQIFGTYTPISELIDANTRSEDDEQDVKYRFRSVTFNNFLNISNCSTGSLSVEIEKSSCANDNYYSHAVNFAFTYSSRRKSGQPFFSSIFDKWSRERSNRYNDAWTRDEKLTSTVKYWSTKLTIITDKNGKLIDDDVKVGLDFELEKTGSTKLDLYSNVLLENLKNKIATSLQNQFQTLLTPPAVEQNSQ